MSASPTCKHTQPTPAGKPSSEITPAGMPECPLYEETARIVALSRDMLRSVRRIKRAQIACRNCSRQADCPLLRRFNLQIAEAIQEIAEELGLSV